MKTGIFHTVAQIIKKTWDEVTLKNPLPFLALGDK
jgi:hypothetical protein